MNQALSKVVVSLANEKHIENLLGLADKFGATQIVNYEGIGKKPVFEFSIKAAQQKFFTAAIIDEFSDNAEVL